MHLEPTNMTACANVPTVPMLLDSQRQILRQRLSCNMLKQQNCFKTKSGLNVTMSTTVSHTQIIQSKNYLKIIYKKT